MTDGEKIRIMVEEMQLPEIRVRPKGLSDRQKDEMQSILQRNGYRLCDGNKGEIVWRKKEDPQESGSC